MKITDIENIYHGLSWEEFKVKREELWTAFDNTMKSINQDLAAIKVRLKRLVRGISRFFITPQPGLSPMTCRTITPARPTDMTIEKWRNYIRDQRRFIQNCNWLDEQQAMEEVLVQAQEILIKK